jgi:hypothetical protein
MAICRSCGAEINFIRLKSGKYNPVDVAKRTFKEGVGADIFITSRGEVLRGEPMSIEEGANKVGYTSHFATCPNADKHRNNRG